MLVIGGTRGTGYLTVGLLQGHGYGVRALARDPARAKKVFGPEVEIRPGDLTRPETLPSAMRDVDHVIFTAGVTRRPAGEDLIIATVYEGMRSTLAAAADVGFRGRFVYMTSIGVNRRSIAGSLLNLVKRNTLHWRRRAEDEIRASELPYTIVRAGVLTNAPGGRRAIEVRQEDYPLAPRYRIARADVAETLVRALEHPATSRATFDVVEVRGERREGWEVLFGRLRPDPCDRAADRDRRDAGPDPQMPAC